MCRRCQPVSQTIQADRPPALTPQMEANLEWQFLTLVEARLEERKQEQLQVQKWRKRLSWLATGVQAILPILMIVWSIAYLLAFDQGLNPLFGFLLIVMLLSSFVFNFPSKKSDSDQK